ncbi:hypothetical protein [Asticcacaulis sp. AC460]|uniref:hypothetical protein n=1 Tax=Asticcacaulis sp. AC460 TaxID=1282360 RepID=UPI0012DC8243|nr:hypothetical protein [Asticcacaulis sp. AC460]
MAAATATSVLLAATAAFAGPFGIKMGAQVKDLKVVEKHDMSAPWEAYSISVPQPNSEFESYMIVLTPQTGVCKVLAIGKTYEDDRYGTSVRSAYDKLKSALSQKYGQPKDYDFLSSGALWKDSEDFAASLDKNERTLASFWSVPLDASNEIADIQLSAEGASLSDTYISLSYELRNFDQCVKLKDSTDNNGL